MMKQEIVVDDLKFRFIQPTELADHLKEAPLLKTLDMRIEALDAQIATVRKSTVESVSFGVGMTQEPTQNSLDFRLTFPLSLGSKNDHKIAALMSERSTCLQLREVYAQKLQLGVDALLNHLVEREERINTLTENEKHYETLFTMAQKGYEGGKMGQFEYLAANNAYYEARLRTLDLKENYIQEVTEIEEKIGRIW